MQVVDVAEALPRMQALASRVWTADVRQHPGQLAWSAAYALPEELDHGPVAIASVDDLDTAWAWQEAPGWLEICVDPDRPEDADTVLGWATEVGGEVATAVLATETTLIHLLTGAGFVVDDEAPWFTHHLLDLTGLEAPAAPDGYALRAVEPDEAEARAACHRGAWSSTSRVTGTAYSRLMQTPPYRLDLDWVAVAADGRMAAYRSTAATAWPARSRWPLCTPRRGRVRGSGWSAPGVTRPTRCPSTATGVWGSHRTPAPSRCADRTRPRWPDRSASLPR